eukprot:gnl/Dysnectes_brevis/2367_a2796_2078.p1 GENE.gnl/Dysnectes_brevis/2367_a2796_2078~~gnl/Dysnectes_brevis/2367_a2796_2078.p1  ORF type:complete len:307 (-),score=100.45 gnl/Dysnectes_brevis/2367_a2796_2078:165-1085(-)
MERYQKIFKVGEGTYGEVYKARDTRNGNIVAIKRIRLEHEEEGVPGTAIREISLLKELDHPYIIKLVDVIHQSHRLHLVFEYLDHDMKKYMDATDAMLPPEVVRSFTYQLTEGIHFCHCRRIMHRDLKPHNLLIDKKGTLKVADFGLARAFGIPIRQFTHEIVTLWYRAPEILLGSRHYSTSVDVWSIGVIFAEMVTKTPLFPGDSEIDELFRIFEILGLPNETTWPGVTGLPDWRSTFPQFKGKGIRSVLKTRLCDEGIDLLEKMLVMDPVKRISAKQALLHPYLRGLADTHAARLAAPATNPQE